MFDPLGLLAILTITGKMLTHDILLTRKFSTCFTKFLQASIARYIGGNTVTSMNYARLPMQVHKHMQHESTFI